jgi:hypothetical protein
MRVRFSEVFHLNAGGSISAKVPVMVGGVRLEPGMEFGRRVRLGTVHFASVAGRDLEVEQQGGVIYLVRPYVPPNRDRASRPLPRMVTAMAHEPIPIDAAP